ncbi:hypothetical protein [Ornithinimicrobium pekingense]|uniref:DUF2157 domain-containing protein n=1 Tax=Ornithinimicrobium pekingense TaxID=384677 RepID=A0ABQ2F6S6_9MICO|nr:hypothetical protein [Ornithinimicrobium pekingense]GGK59442.1 hypothetical protein GCM10011509_04640 [Ornithinimicrobium pekingense]
MSESGIPGRVVTALVGAGLVDPQRVDAAESVVEQTLATLPQQEQAAARPRVGPRLTEVGAYAGAALVVAAVILLGAQYWGDLSPLQRTLLLAAVAAVLLAGAVTLVRVAGGSWRAPTRVGLRVRLLAGTLVAAAAVSAGVALGSWVYDATVPPASFDEHNLSMTAGVGLALVVLVGGYLLVPSVLLHLALGAATVMLLTSVWLGEGDGRELVRGGITLAVAGGWLLLTRRGWAERTAGSGVGALLLLLGAQLLLEHDNPGWAHGATLAVALGLFGLYWWRGEWPFLAVGVLALTMAVTEALVEWTEGSLGAGGAVLVAGLTLLAASGGAVLLRRRREHDHADRPDRPGRFHLGRRERHA